ncbi:MAG: ABC transporter substrate-binding protein [Actinobacteria bacterium]|nr:ABC transporter substrate-binding protein [Actinomycetota bacterium]
MPRWGKGAAALFVAVLITAAGCGSTVGSRTAVRGGDGLDGTGADDLVLAEGESATGDASGGVGGTGTTATGGPAGTSGPAGTGGTNGRGGGAGGRGGAGSGGKAPVGRGVRGVTDDTIHVGLRISSQDSGAFFGAIGAGGDTTNSAGSGGATAEAARAVATYINANGGIAGRKLELVLAEIKALGQQDQEYQNACARWTEDNAVFAIMASPGQGMGCATRTNTVLLSELTPGGLWASESSYRQSRGLWYGPTYPLVERRNTALVDSLHRRGWFTPGAKVGILIEDSPWHREGVEKGMIPALARHGITPAAQIVMTSGSQSWSTWAFTLQREGVTHVLWSTSDALWVTPGLMLQAASSQRYYPKWGFGSDQAFQDGVVLAMYPEDQRPNMTGIGWNPVHDTGTKDLSGSPNAQACNKIGETSKHNGAIYYCEILFFLKFALDNATEISPTGMSEAMARVGDRYQSVQNVDGRSRYSPTRHDGPAAYRPVVYRETCKCFVYDGAASDF